MRAVYLYDCACLQLLATREDLAENEKQQKVAEARRLMAAQSFEGALAVLDSLSATHPKDPAVLKLRSLVQREQEKQAKAEKVQRELDTLKKLMGEKKYPEVIARAQAFQVEVKRTPSPTSLPVAVKALPAVQREAFPLLAQACGTGHLGGRNCFCVLGAAMVWPSCRGNLVSTTTESSGKKADYECGKSRPSKGG
jgi:predicted Zn-dependent protease